MNPKPYQAAIELSENLLAPDQPLWKDGVLTADELTDVMARVVLALESASVDSQQRAIGACLYNFEANPNPDPNPNPSPNPNPIPSPNPTPRRVPLQLRGREAGGHG